MSLKHQILAQAKLLAGELDEKQIACALTAPFSNFLMSCVNFILKEN